jgi:hypothetical protein
MKKLIDTVDYTGAASVVDGLTTGRPRVAPNAGAPFSRLLDGKCELSTILESEFIRLPAPGGRCVISGLSRSTLNEAIDRGDIRAVTVRQPGAMRGIKLIVVASLRGWLRRLDTEQNPLQATQPAAALSDGGGR